MLITQNSIDGAVTITADIPADTQMPPAGVFQKITTLNWHGIRSTDSRVMSDASVPCMVEITLADGAELLLWPDGTFVLYPEGTQGRSWSNKITADGVIPNPFRD
jgi:hypothetical protein